MYTEARQLFSNFTLLLDIGKGYEFVGAMLAMVAIASTITYIWRRSLWPYLLCPLLYVQVMFNATIRCREDYFDVLRLLCYALFIGAFLLCALNFYLARKHFKIISAFFALGAIVLAGTALDAFIIEPHALGITRYQIASAKITRPIKIGVLSDLQTDNVSEYEEKALSMLMAEKADLILLPGDYIQTYYYNDRVVQNQKLNNAMRNVNLSAPLGVFAVQGNVEARNWPIIFSNLPVTTFRTKGTVETGELSITGLMLDDSFNQGLQVPGRQNFHIIVGHGPDFALANPDADLLIAGHTHGGQVQIPFFGPPITASHVPRTWGAGGLFDLDADTKLMITRGVGMERIYAPRLRFLCRPEIVMIDLVPATH